jgi:hypothetical protein
MKRAISMLGLLAVLCTAISLATIADSKTTTMTGWISDNACGVKGASAEHKACGATCMKTKGASFVFVQTSDKKVIPIANQDAVTIDQMGQEVKVTGHMTDDGSLHVDKVDAKS